MRMISPQKPNLLFIRMEVDQRLRMPSKIMDQI